MPSTTKPAKSANFNMKIPRYNRETEEAMREARDIASGKISAKAYRSAEELFADLDAEDDEG